tara:strand:+ start:551 stop:916 length:366 start_codon:yes stop_codon:yes gene_type:complete
MTLIGKAIFILIVFFMYWLGFLVARTNSAKALQKLLIMFFGTALLLSIIFSNAVWIILPKALGVARGSDSVLYLFIIISTSVSLILLRKILELEYKFGKIVQYIALEKGTKENKDRELSAK